jgi:hypothetical protein
MTGKTALDRLRLAYGWLDNWRTLTDMNVMKIRKAIHDAVAAWQIDREELDRAQRRIRLLEDYVKSIERRLAAMADEEDDGK